MMRTLAEHSIIRWIDATDITDFWKACMFLALDNFGVIVFFREISDSAYSRLPKKCWSSFCPYYWSYQFASFRFHYASGAVVTCIEYRVYENFLVHARASGSESVSV